MARLIDTEAVHSWTDKDGTVVRYTHAGGKDLERQHGSEEDFLLLRHVKGWDNLPSVDGSSLPFPADDAARAKILAALDSDTRVFWRLCIQGREDAADKIQATVTGGAPLPVADKGETPDPLPT